MAAIIAAINFTPRNITRKLKASLIIRSSSSSSTTTNVSVNGKPISSTKKAETAVVVEKNNKKALDYSEIERLSVKDYLERSKELIRPDGGPPRWFSPLECGAARLNNAPLLLYLPGLDGVGLGLILHHQRLGKMFDIWCLHIPVTDRTPFEDLVHLVERTVKTENSRSPNRPIYLVGESVGGCLALAVAARNPGIDLMLILANPATSFSKSQLQPLLPFLDTMSEQLYLGFPYILGFLTGDPFKMMMAAVEKGTPPEQAVGELSQNLVAILPSLPVSVKDIVRHSFSSTLKESI